MKSTIISSFKTLIITMKMESLFHELTQTVLVTFSISQDQIMLLLEVKYLRIFKIF